MTKESRYKEKSDNNITIISKGKHSGDIHVGDKKEINLFSNINIIGVTILLLVVFGAIAAFLF